MNNKICIWRDYYRDRDNSISPTDNWLPVVINELVAWINEPQAGMDINLKMTCAKLEKLKTEVANILPRTRLYHPQLHVPRLFPSTMLPASIWIMQGAHSCKFLLSIISHRPSRHKFIGSWMCLLLVLIYLHLSTRVSIEWLFIVIASRMCHIAFASAFCWTIC
jgi:hypothetical protein